MAHISLTLSTTPLTPIGISSAKSAKFRGIRPRMYIGDLL